MIVRMFAPDYDSLLNKRGQFAAYRRARTDIQQQELLQRYWLPLLFRISDLDDDIEIDDGPEERKMPPFKFPNFPQSSE
jgi:hypothetical protein